MLVIDGKQLHFFADRRGYIVGGWHVNQGIYMVIWICKDSHAVYFCRAKVSEITHWNIECDSDGWNPKWILHLRYPPKEISLIKSFLVTHWSSDMGHHRWKLDYTASMHGPLMGYIYKYRHIGIATFNVFYIVLCFSCIHRSKSSIQLWRNMNDIVVTLVFSRTHLMTSWQSVKATVLFASP